MRPASRAAVFAAATVAAVSCTGAALSFASATAPETKTSQSSTTFDNALIARTALQYVGRWGGEACIDAHHAAFGQCKQFVNCVVSLASGGRAYPVDPDGDYQQSFADVGGVEVKAPNAVTGDIIQVGYHDDDAVLHTAIVLVNHHNGSYTVVDANYVGQPEVQEMVGVHEWTPPTGARFWRLGTATPVLPSDLAKMIKQVSRQTVSPAAPPQAPTLTATIPGGIASGTITVNTVTPPTGSAATAERVWVDGHAFATWPVPALDPTFPLDTTVIPDGVHHLRAQAITAFGAVSALGPDLTVTIANKTPAVAVVVPGEPAAGTVTLGAVTSPPAAKDVLTVSVDGKAQPAPGLQFDASALAPGTHTVTISAAGPDGKVAATSAPATIVTGPATTQRVAVDINGSGRSDLVALDSSGHVVRYAATGDGTFGRAQVIDPAQAHGTVRLLAVGRFATADSPMQLLAVWSDGSAHLYTFDVDGTLGDDTLVGGDVAWGGFIRLTTRADGRLVGTRADGGQSVVTFALAQVVGGGPTEGPTDGVNGGVGVDAGVPAGPGVSGTSGASGASSAASSGASGAPSGGASGGPGKPVPSGSAGVPGVPVPSGAAPSGAAGSASGSSAASGKSGGSAQSSASGPASGPATSSGVAPVDGVVVPDPATVPGVIAVAVPLTPPPAVVVPSAPSAPSAPSSKPAVVTAPASVPAAPVRTVVNAVFGHFTADGKLDLLTTYSDGTSDLRPAAPAPAAAGAPVVAPVLVVFETSVVAVADASQIHHQAALSEMD